MTTVDSANPLIERLVTMRRDAPGLVNVRRCQEGLCLRSPVAGLVNLAMLDRWMALLEADGGASMVWARGATNVHEQTIIQHFTASPVFAPNVTLASAPLSSVIGAADAPRRANVAAALPLRERPVPVSTAPTQISTFVTQPPLAVSGPQSRASTSTSAAESSALAARLRARADGPGVARPSEIVVMRAPGGVVDMERLAMPMHTRGGEVRDNAEFSTVVAGVATSGRAESHTDVAGTRASLAGTTTSGAELVMHDSKQTPAAAVARGVERTGGSSAGYSSAAADIFARDSHGRAMPLASGRDRARDRIDTDTGVAPRAHSLASLGAGTPLVRASEPAPGPGAPALIFRKPAPAPRSSQSSETVHHQGFEHARASGDGQGWSGHDPGLSPLKTGGVVVRNELDVERLFEQFEARLVRAAERRGGFQLWK